MRRVIVPFLLIALVFACKPSKDISVASYKPVSVATFIEQPFGENESVAALKKRFGKEVKLKKMIRRNRHDSQKVDTIFQFYTRKSEVFVYKTSFNREMLLGGVIVDSKFPMINGVVSGMLRDDFFKSFNDIEHSKADSVVLNSKELTRKFTFVFDSKGKIKKISFSLYVD